MIGKLPEQGQRDLLYTGEQAVGSRHLQRQASQAGKKSRKSKAAVENHSRGLLHELVRKMSDEQKARYRKELSLYKRVINQQKDDKDKIYNPHKPFTRCISKGKAHKQYEFGNKVGLITTGKRGRKIITAIKAFLDTPYDEHTIDPLLEQMEQNKLKLPQEPAYDLGGKSIQINAYMATTAWNLERMMEKLIREFLCYILRIFFKQRLQLAT